MKNQSELSNSQGAAYFAVNFIGWATGKTPWEALSGLDLDMSGKRITIGAKTFDEKTKEVHLYYLPDEKKFKGTEMFAPIDDEQNPCGVLLYAGLSTHNEKVVFNNLFQVKQRL